MVKISPIVKQYSLYHDTDKPFKCFKFFYLLFHVILGLDFGFMKFKCFRCVTSKLLTVIQNIIISGWAIYNVWRVETPLKPLLQSCFIIQYLVHTLILLRIKEETTFYNLIQNLRTIDTGLKVHHASYKWEIKLLLTVFLFILYKVLFFISFMPHYTVWHLIMYVSVLVASDIVRVSYAFMFYAANCRLKTLGSLIKAGDSDFLSKQYLYKSILDIAVQHKEGFDPLLVTELLFNVTVVLSSVYVTVLDIKENRTKNLTVGIFTEYAFCFHILTLTVMPALCAGMLATQAENIKNILHDLLLQPKCVAEFGDIKRFIRYVEMRGCRFRVWKLLPLDADLLQMVVSFGVTYLIVIIEFIYK